MGHDILCARQTLGNKNKHSCIYIMTKDEVQTLNKLCIRETWVDINAETNEPFLHCEDMNNYLIKRIQKFVLDNEYHILKTYDNKEEAKQELERIKQSIKNGETIIEIN